MSHEIHTTLRTILFDSCNQSGKPSAFFDMVAMIDVIDQHTAIAMRPDECFDAQWRRTGAHRFAQGLRSGTIIARAIGDKHDIRIRSTAAAGGNGLPAGSAASGEEDAQQAESSSPKRAHRHIPRQETKSNSDPL